MFTRIAAITVFAAALLPGAATAQDDKKPPADKAAPQAKDEAKTEVATVPLVIDLASEQEQNIRVGAGTYRIVLMNAVPGRAYWLHIGPSITLELPPLSAEGVKFESHEFIDLPDKCAAAKAARTLIESQSEADVRKNVDLVRMELAKMPTDDTDCGKTVVEAVKAVVDATQISFSESPVVIAAETRRTVQIASRNGGRWWVDITSMGRGAWQTTYGFAFNPNRDDEYYNEATGESQFAIRKKPREEKSITAIPTVFFTWLSTKQATRNLQHGPTLGVGVTAGDAGGRLAALAGWSLRFNQNIGVVGGLSVYQHRRLDGQYHEGQVLKENLTADKLNDDVTLANVFFAFTLRFGSSPFGGDAGQKGGK